MHIIDIIDLIATIDIIDIVDIIYSIDTMDFTHIIDIVATLGSLGSRMTRSPRGRQTDCPTLCCGEPGQRKDLRSCKTGFSSLQTRFKRSENRFTSLLSDDAIS